MNSDAERSTTTLDTIGHFISMGQFVRLLRVPNPDVILAIAKEEPA